LAALLAAVGWLARSIPVVDPVRPRARASIAELGVPEGLLLVEPVGCLDAISLQATAQLVLTDSGGIQEEAPSFGVPALVLREVTERVESLAAGCARLVGTNPSTIVAEAMRLLDDPTARAAMTANGNPYGDGKAAVRTEEAVADLLGVAAPRRPVLTLVPSVGA
jgi:UDP-N-acetylglucosamine 2-epimerase (non-hydrolysing)